MSTIKEKQTLTDTRKQLSIELCNNFIRRLNPNQSKEIKIGAIIAIRNFIKESKIDDPFLFSYLVDTMSDSDIEVRDTVTKVIKEVVNSEIIELLEIKIQEANSEIKTEIKNLLQALKH